MSANNATLTVQFEINTDTYFGEAQAEDATETDIVMAALQSLESKLPHGIDLRDGDVEIVTGFDEKTTKLLEEIVEDDENDFDFDVNAVFLRTDAIYDEDSDEFESWDHAGVRARQWRVQKMVEDEEDGERVNLLAFLLSDSSSEYLRGDYNENEYIREAQIKGIPTVVHNLETEFVNRDAWGDDEQEAAAAQ